MLVFRNKAAAHHPAAQAPSITILLIFALICGFRMSRKSNTSAMVYWLRRSIEPRTHLGRDVGLGWGDGGGGEEEDATVLLLALFFAMYSDPSAPPTDSC